MKKLSRTDSRKKAFELLFSSNQYIDNIEELFSDFLDDEEISKKNLDYIKDVVCGAVEKNDELEEIISSKLAKGWSLSRLSKVAKTILKLSIYEILYIEDVPAKVAANEAVELAKKYGDENEPSFINGVLANIIKEKAID